MSADYNAMAVALKNSNMKESDLIVALDDLRSLSIKVIDEAGDAISPETKQSLQAHIDRLKPIMNAAFRKVGINSDPFKPRYTTHRISYFHDSRGFVLFFHDENGDQDLKPVVVTPGKDDFLYVEACPSAVLEFDMTESQIGNAAKTYVSMVSRLWEIPNKEPHVFLNTRLSALLDEALEQKAKLSVPALGL